MTARSARALHLLLPALVGAAVTLAMLVSVSASTDPGLPVDGGGVSSWWWQSGALAAPIALVCFGVLIGLERLSTTRWPGLSWLRRGSVRAYLSLTIAALVGLLPQIADGSATWGGLSVAMMGGMVAFRPGGGETKQVQAEEPPV